MEWVWGVTRLRTPSNSVFLVLIFEEGLLLWYSQQCSMNILLHSFSFWDAIWYFFLVLLMWAGYISLLAVRVYGLAFSLQLWPFYGIPWSGLGGICTGFCTRHSYGAVFLWLWLANLTCMESDKIALVSLLHWWWWRPPKWVRNLGADCLGFFSGVDQHVGWFVALGISFATDCANSEWWCFPCF